MIEIDDSLKEGARQLLNAIRSDDKESFDAIIVNARYTTLSFGRFPLLSLIYLYNARAISKAYEKELISIKDYNFVDENEEAYQLFKQFAGRSLRLYANSDRVITPVEMLAVLEHDEKLKKLYKVDKSLFEESSEGEKSLSYIYEATHGRTARSTEKGLKVSRRHLPKRKLATVILTSVLVAVFILFSAGFTGWTFSFGDGSENNPIKISSADGLTKMLATDDSCVLSKDIILDSVNLEVYYGTLDGNGHTLYINNTVFPFIDTLYGNISNLNIVFGELDITADNSVSLFTNHNKGEISHVTLNADCTFTVPTEEDGKENPTRYISVVTQLNDGEIKNVAVNGKINVSGSHTVNTYVSAVAGKNGGQILYCSTSEDMSVTTDTADIGGIVSENLEGGTVSGCVNKASLSQTTAYGNWNPNVGGIAVTNDGSIIGCVNNGSLNASNSDTDDSATENIYIGGITVSNNKAVNRCKNNGAINASGTTVYVYAGGIVSLNSTGATLTECGEMGEIKAACGTAGNNFCFVGGISGYNDGYVLSCFSNASITSSGLNAISGGVVGVSDNNSFIQTYLGQTAFYASNYFVGTSTAKFGIASFLYEYTDELTGEKGTGVSLGGNLGTTLCVNLDALKTAPVYWE